MYNNYISKTNNYILQLIKNDYTCNHQPPFEPHRVSYRYQLVIILKSYVCTFSVDCGCQELFKTKSYVCVYICIYVGMYALRLNQCTYNILKHN